MRSPTARAGQGWARCQRRPRALPGICAVAWAVVSLLPAAAAPDGAGTMTVSPPSVTAGRAVTLVFTYTASATQEVKGGTVTVTVPPGWTPPSQAPGPGETFASCPFGCTLSVAAGSMTITVSGVGVNPGQAFTITYSHAFAPGEAGSAVFTADEASFSTGTLTPLAGSPVETVAGSASSSASASASPSPSPSPSPSESASATGSASASASASPSVTAASQRPAAAPSSPAALPVASRWPLRRGGLGLLAVAVLAAGALAARLVRRRPRPLPPGRVRAVPHHGPPAPVIIHDTGTEPALTVRIEPHAAAARPALEEVRS